MPASDMKTLSDFIAAQPVPTSADTFVQYIEGYATGEAGQANYELLDIFNVLIEAGSITKEQVEIVRTDVKTKLTSVEYGYGVTNSWGASTLSASSPLSAQLSGAWTKRIYNMTW